jgi:hypothetical protein
MPKEGGTFGVYVIKMITLVFISLMNLVLKRQSLEVYQARDEGNNLTIFNYGRMMTSLN